MIWSEFIAEVLGFLHVDAERHGIELFREQSIRAGVIDIQSMLPAMRAGHTTTVQAADFTQDGIVAGTVAAPDGVVREIRFIPKAVDEDRPGSSNHVTYRKGLWEDRKCMVMGVSTALGQWALSPDQRTIILAPTPDADHSVQIVWDGLKRSFASNDETPFTSEVAEAVSEFVKGRITLHVDKEVQLAATHFQNYGTLRRRINSDLKEKENA